MKTISILRKNKMTIFFTLVILSSTGFAVTDIILPILLLERYSIAQASINLFISGIGSIISLFIIGYLIDKYSPMWVLKRFCVIYILSLSCIITFEVPFIVQMSLFLKGLVFPAFGISIRTLFSHLFDDFDELDKINSSYFTLQYIAYIIVPLVFAKFHNYTDTKSFIFADIIFVIIFLLFLKIQGAKYKINNELPYEKMQILSGIRIIFKSQFLIGIITLLFVLNLTTESFYIIIPEIMNVKVYGYFFSVLSIGSVIGSYLYSIMAFKNNLGNVLIISNVIIALTIIFMGLHSGLAVVLILAFVQGVYTSFIDIGSVSMRQKLVPKVEQGRVFSTTMIINKLGVPLGNLLTGLLLSLNLSNKVLFIYGLILILATCIVRLHNPYFKKDSTYE